MSMFGAICRTTRYMRGSDELKFRAYGCEPICSESIYSLLEISRVRMAAL